MRHDLLSDAMSIINNAEKVGKTECIIKPTSKLVKSVIKIMKDKGYIKEYEYIEDNKGGILKVHLHKKINKCQAIRPRFPCKQDEIEKFETRFLPAKGFGILIISTPQGLMTNIEAKKKRIGGVMIAYVY